MEHYRKNRGISFYVFKKPSIFLFLVVFGMNVCKTRDLWKIQIKRKKSILGKKPPPNNKRKTTQKATAICISHWFGYYCELRPLQEQEWTQKSVQLLTTPPDEHSIALASRDFLPPHPSRVPLPPFLYFLIESLIAFILAYKGNSKMYCLRSAAKQHVVLVFHVRHTSIQYLSWPISSTKLIFHIRYLSPKKEVTKCTNRVTPNPDRASLIPSSKYTFEKVLVGTCDFKSH